MSDPFTLIPDMNGASRYLCLSCGKEFTRKYNLQRHWEIVHGEPMDDNEPRSEEEEEEREEEPEPSDHESSDESDKEMEDNEVYRDWYEEAVQANQEPRNRKYQKYIEEENVDDARAREKAYAKTLWAIKGHFFDSLETFLIQTIRLRDDDAFQEIVTDIDEKTEKGMDLNKAVKRVLPKYKHKFESLFEYNPELEEEEAESDGEEDEDPDEAPPPLQLVGGRYYKTL